MANLCKQNDCNYVYPIIETDSLGNSLSSINYNFKSLDIGLCNLEQEAELSWKPAYSLFSNLSALWSNAINVMLSNSACWTETYNNVASLSAHWLKPITIVYPYPFSLNSTSIPVIEDWLNNTLPPINGNCINYIVGQTIIVHSPEYRSLNRNVNKTVNNGIRKVEYTYRCDCIGKGSYTQKRSMDVDCGVSSFVGSTQDQYINRFLGIRFTVNESLKWSDGILLF